MLAKTLIIAATIAAGTALAAAPAQAVNGDVIGSASCQTGVRVLADSYGKGSGRILVVRIDDRYATATVTGERGTLAVTVPADGEAHTFMWGAYNPNHGGHWRSGSGTLACP